MVVFLTLLLYMCLPARHVKKLSSTQPTNIVITGGVQGLGKLLAGEFLGRTPKRSVNMIVVDIRDDLEKTMRDELASIIGD